MSYSPPTSWQGHEPQSHLELHFELQFEYCSLGTRLINYKIPYFDWIVVSFDCEYCFIQRSGIDDETNNFLNFLVNNKEDVRCVRINNKFRFEISQRNRENYYNSLLK